MAAAEIARRVAELEASGQPLGQLDSIEIWWRDHQEWLAEKGYMLRPRYRPGWKPSWANDAYIRAFEEGVSPVLIDVLDATRVSDNSLVALKRVRNQFNPYEIEIAQYLYSETLRSDPRNHTVPILEVFPVPDDPQITLIVMPFLRPCDDPGFYTLGEAISFVKQVLEGLQYMHELHVAHRDGKAGNIMYDPRPLFPDMYHPVERYRSRDWKGRAKYSTRTECPVRYYFIDFGLSRRYDPKNGPPREYPILGGDKTVPEFTNWNGEPLDPFPTDIYYIGNMIRHTIIAPYKGFEFLVPLVKDMIQTDPSKRPTIQEVSRRFEELVKVLSRWRLRSRLVHVKEDPIDKLFRTIGYPFRTFRYILERRPAIPPTPPPYS
ncbi:hypothetical protein L227DRAFT_613500 [Lentinus tigrinus ALCF2SS1-6]|uniref:Protein kinase domain-containing protein n=1 Tax=Lentinus tigrinus ALCF2SS1-6 TaxID=1328759 RepID=A0A5C2S223_9APHY|nr:hypothetical protein L227DRAFT_613500 [Lentinus tigrinus ALCF2SS1-6]